MNAPRDTVDVAVIGGGPAGAVAALCLARDGHSVALLERDNASENDWKIGEGLPPAARPVLAQLGVWERFAAAGHLASHGNCTAWGAPRLREQNFLFNPYGHGWHLERNRFDRMLRAAAVAAGAISHSGVRVVSCQRDAAHWRLDLAADRQLKARYIVDASGRGSWFARQQGARRVNYDNLTGLVALLTPGVGQVDNLSHGQPVDRDSLTLVEAVETGWWYAALLASGKLVAAYLSDGDLPATKTARSATGWWCLLEQTEHLARRVTTFGYRLERGPRIVSANSSRLTSVAGADWLAVGDAAAAYDPLSSQGILAALETGTQAAAALHARLQGGPPAFDRYAQSLDERWTSYLASRRFYYAQERRWPASLFWQRRRNEAQRGAA